MSKKSRLNKKPEHIFTLLLLLLSLSQNYLLFHSTTNPPPPLSHSLIYLFHIHFIFVKTCCPPSYNPFSSTSNIHRHLPWVWLLRPSIFFICEIIFSGHFYHARSEDEHFEDCHGFMFLLILEMLCGYGVFRTRSVYFVNLQIL